MIVCIRRKSGGTVIHECSSVTHYVEGGKTEWIEIRGSDVNNSDLDNSFLVKGLSRVDVHDQGKWVWGEVFDVPEEELI